MTNDCSFYTHDPRPRPRAYFGASSGYTWLGVSLSADPSTEARITIFRPLADCREIARELIQALEAALAQSEEGGAG